MYGLIINVYWLSFSLVLRTTSDSFLIFMGTNAPQFECTMHNEINALHKYDVKVFLLFLTTDFSAHLMC